MRIVWKDSNPKTKQTKKELVKKDNKKTNKSA